MRYSEIIEAVENDDDMFSTSSTLATGAKQAIKQIEDPYLRTVRRVRELAKTGFGIKTRVSSVPKSASRGRATFWFGDYVRDSNDPYDKAPEAPPVAQEIKAELERQGFECKFTGSGWLSVLVPPTYSDLLREENDDDLFGQEDPVRRALKLLMKLKPAVKQNPYAVRDILERNKWEEPAQIIEKIYDFMADAAHMPRQYFDHMAEDMAMLPVRGNWNRPWEFWDVRALDKDIKILMRYLHPNALDESDDDELFADRKSTQLATFFAEMAREWYGIADDQRDDFANEEYADGTESAAYAFEGVSNAFRVGMESGIAAFRGLDTMLREHAADEIAEVLDIDIYELAYPEDLDESDYWTEGAAAELEEPPERPRKTTTKTKPDTKFDIPFQQDQDQPLAHTDPLDDLKKKAGVGGNKPEVNLRKASQQDTLSKTSGLSTPDMGDMLGRMRDIELDKDLEAYPDEDPGLLPSVEVNTQNLPAVAGQALQAAGVQNPEFHQVSNLPGNMADQIRQLGKSLFGSLTMTPTKRIHVVANLGGQGPNSTQEVNAVAGFLKQHGDDRGPGDIDFEQVMPGYKAQTHMYTAAGIRWMLVKDFAGQYIYCWPEADSHDADPGLEYDEPEMKQLR